ncbi:hypothetical protein [Methylobacterium sp.]|uniref:hypothetical protein n=1 Tax=Methylobacterium sp. TaxID=409 RepID=UPI003B02262A
MRDPHGDVAVHEICFVEIREAEILSRFALFDHPRLERRHIRRSPLASKVTCVEGALNQDGPGR